MRKKPDPYVITTQSGLLCATIQGGHFDGIPLGLVMALNDDLLQATATAGSIRKRGWVFAPEMVSAKQEGATP